MNRRWFLAGLAAAIAVGGVSADARMHAPYRGHRIVPAQAGVLDGFTAPSAAYSFRKLRSAYAGPAVKLQRVDTTTQDIGFTAAGDFDVAAAAAFCSTACTVQTLYDQSGAGRDMTQATAASQPAYVANCNGALPCFQTTSAALTMNSPTMTPATGVATISAVGKRTAGTALCWMLREGSAGQRLGISATPGSWQASAGGSLVVPGAAENAWHAAVAVYAGASSVVNIDGTETAGTTGAGVTTAGTLQLIGGAATTCQQSEMVIWDNYISPPAERAALVANQRNYWMPAPLDSFTTPSGAYSFRKLKSTYSGPAVRIRRASDDAETDINFLGCTGFTGCPWNEVAAAAHCAATSCFVKTIYDQSGLARDLVQATPANQPQLIFNCIGALPCLRTINAVTMGLFTVASITPSTGVASIGVVGSRVTGTGQCVFFRENGSGGSNRIQGQTGIANSWSLGASTGTVNVAATDAVAHAAVGVVNGASSSLTVDGATTAGSVTNSVAAGTAGVLGIAATTCSHGEAIAWDAYLMPPAEIAVLQANQKSFWGTP